MLRPERDGTPGGDHGAESSGGRGKRRATSEARLHGELISCFGRSSAAPQLVNACRTIIGLSHGGYKRTSPKETVTLVATGGPDRPPLAADCRSRATQRRDDVRSRAPLSERKSLYCSASRADAQVRAMVGGGAALANRHLHSRHSSRAGRAAGTRSVAPKGNSNVDEGSLRE